MANRKAGLRPEAESEIIGEFIVLLPSSRPDYQGPPSSSRCGPSIPRDFKRLAKVSLGIPRNLDRGACCGTAAPWRRIARRLGADEFRRIATRSQSRLRDGFHGI
jgi:hypothetical protein